MAEQATAAPAPQPSAAPAPEARPQSVEERIAALRARDHAPPEPEAPEQPAAEPEQAEAEAPEAEAAQSDDAAPQDAPAQDESDGEEVALSTLSDLAEYLGTDVSDLYNIRIPVNGADGTRSEVSLSEWKDAFQAHTKLTSEQRALNEQRKAWEAERQSRMQQLETRLTEAAAMAEHAERLYMADMERVDWNGLRESAPDEYAAKRQDFLERRQQLAAYKQQVMGQLQHYRAEQVQAQQHQMAERLQTEAAKLLDAVPEWRDEGKAKAEKQALTTYLRDAGFSDHDIANAADHRLIAMARKAMLYDQQRKQVATAKKKVVKLGKSVLKPGAKQSKADAKQDALKGLRGNLRKSGRLEDAVALLAARRRS